MTSDSHRRTRFTDQSNIRVLGGKAAGPKPIKANYDDDDARIVELKQQGWSDEYVARKLAEEGRIRYVGRTVGSRWLRIRKALEAKEEEILEDNLSDWHEGEVSFHMFYNLKALLTRPRTIVSSRPSKRSTRRSTVRSPSFVRRNGCRLLLTLRISSRRRSTPLDSAASVTTA